MKILVAKNILPPYRVEFLRELGKLSDLTLVLDAVSEPGREWKVESDFPEMEVKLLNSRALTYDYKGAEGKLQEKRARQLSLGLWKVLGETRPDCVVSAELGLRTILATLWCKIHKVPLVIWWEGTLHTEGGVSGLRLQLRRFLVARAARFWSNGKASRAYLEQLGANPESIDDGMTGVNTRFFMASQASLQSKETELRNKYGVGDLPVVLFSGALSERKGISRFLEVLEALEKRKGPSFCCLMAGDGELRSEIEKRSQNWSRVRVVLTGFIQKEELCECYSLADLYVLPTLEDNWALATLEPLLFGVPSLISVRNGAVEDLALPGSEDWVSRFDPENQEEFIEVLEARLKNPDTRLPEREVKRLAEFYRSDSQARRALVCAKKARGENHD